MIKLQRCQRISLRKDYGTRKTYSREIQEDI